MRIQRLFLAAVGLACAAGPVAAQERTVASANEFIEHVSNRGTARIGIYKIDRLEGEGCNTRIDGHFMDSGRRFNASLTLDWADFTEVRHPYINQWAVRVAGPIVRTLGDGTVDTQPSETFEFESEPIAERAAVAFEFLRTSCDRSSGTGF